MSALIGALRVSLSAETAQFEAGMKRAQRTAATTRSSFQKSFGGLANIVKGGFAGVISGLSLGLIIQGVKASLQYAGSLAEISQQLGVTTRDLQVFRYAAGQVGVEQSTLETGLKKLTITMGQMAAGAKAPRAALDAVRKGLADQVLAAKDSGEAFRIIADGLKNVTDRSQRAAVEVAIFKKSGADLDNLLAGGSGTIDDYGKALEKLGGILSDEEIQSADLTADKIEELNNQLKANIAGAIARNSGAILDLANSLIFLVSKLGRALTAWNDFKNALDAQAFDIASKNPLLSAKKRAEGAERAARARGKISDSGIGWHVGGSKVIIDLPPVNAPKPTSGGDDIGKFLSGGGGGRSKRDTGDDAARKAAEERRRLAQVGQESLRAEIDILQARKSLAHDYSERYALSIQILDLEKQGYEAELADRVADGDLKDAEAKKLKLKNDEIHALEVKILQEEEEEQRQRDYNMLEAKDFELKRDILERQAELANNSAERRDVEMKILDLAYQEERERLERITRESKDWAEIEAARRDLLALSKKQGLDREITRRQTAGPFESAQIQFGDITDEMEQLKVDGIMGAADALTALTGGFDDFRDAAISAIKQVIAEFIRLQLLKAAFSIFGSAAGAPGAGSVLGSGGFFGGGGYVGIGTPAFATGGGFNVMGNRGVDKNLLQLNGLPIARVSHGERVSISNDNQRSGGQTNINFAISGPVSRETMGQIAAKTKLAVASANRKGF